MLRHRREVAAKDAHRATDLGGRRQHAEQVAQHHRLAGAAFSDHAEHLAGGKIEADAIDRVDFFRLPAQADGQVADLDRYHAAARLWPEPGCAIRHATAWAVPVTARSSGTLAAQTGSASAQRVWKRQPGGGSIGFGGSPASGATVVRRRGSRLGLEAG